MGKPTIAWIPLRYVDEIVEGRMRTEEWLQQVPLFGLQAVEIYHGFVTPSNRESVKELLGQLNLQVAQFTCAPDFTNPDASARKRELEEMKHKVETAAYLGAPAVRVTAGMVHEGLTEQEGLRYALEGMVALAEFAEPIGVKLCYENHYRDRRWAKEDFSFRPEIFLRLFEQIEPTPIMVNFDLANPLMAGADGVALLKRVVHKVYQVHASDRLPGMYQHCVLGTGSVEFDPLLQILAQHGYQRYITIEDGQPEGDEGFRRSISFLQAKIDRFWT